MIRRDVFFLLLLSAFAFACTGQTPSVLPPKREVPKKEAVREAPAMPQETKEPPPPSAPARPFKAPKITWAELPNGVKMASRLERAVPMINLRIVALAGSSVDGERTGLATVCAKAIASSGTGATSDFDVRTKLETLGATLTVDVDADRVMYGLSVQKDWLDEAFGLLAKVVTKPGLGEKDIARVKESAAEEAANKARGDGRWGASMVMQKALFVLPSEQHPYATYDATKTDIEAIKPADCRAYHRRYVTPKNLLVAAAGDVKPEALRAVVEKHLGALRGAAAPSVSFTDPMPPDTTKMTLVDRPFSTQSEVLVGMLGPKREEAAFANLFVAWQVLGGAYTGRLFTELREKRGLVSLTFSSLWTFANGPSVFYTYAHTQNESTGAVLSAMLEHVRDLGETAPSEDEVEIASRYLAGQGAVNAGMPGQSANEIVDLWVQRLPDEAPEEFSRAVRQATPEAMSRVVAEYARPSHAVIVVAGDATKIGPELQAFGEVKVVDPTQGFHRVRTLPAKP